MTGLVKRLHGMALLAVAFCRELTTGWSHAATRRVEEALTSVSVDSPEMLGFATFRDDASYIQCHRLDDGRLRCVSASVLWEPSAANFLRLVRLAALASLGWRLDGETGTFTIILPAGPTTAQAALLVERTLIEACDADPDRVEIGTTWVGLPQGLPAGADAAVAGGLIALYGPLVEAVLGDLRGGSGPTNFVVFGVGIGSIQCTATTMPAGVHCAVRSSVTSPALTLLLSRDRVAWLTGLGYAEPGEVPGYTKVYLAHQWSDACVAAEILTILHVAYDYTGAIPLRIETG